MPYPSDYEVPIIVYYEKFGGNNTGEILVDLMSYHYQSIYIC